MDTRLQGLIYSFVLLCLLCFAYTPVFAEVANRLLTLNVTVLDSDKKTPIKDARIFSIKHSLSEKTNSEGKVSFPYRSNETILYTISADGYFNKKIKFRGLGDTNIVVVLKSTSSQTKEVVVEADKHNDSKELHLSAVQDVTIFESKKTEQIIVEDLSVNRASNTARQIYSRVAGLNVWENDGSGVQLNIGARGLSPNRTSNFNTRQNGYEISADALGYPESYYTPPAEAIERIEIIRGAASLQYGTQFGGMLNFIIHTPTEDTNIHINSLQTLGSFGLLGTFNSINVRRGDVSIYGYYQHKSGTGWRPNSDFNIQNIYVASEIKISDDIGVFFDYTRMDYLAKQPGGLSDVEFQRDPSQSFRARNWFDVEWNLFSARLDVRISDNIKLKSQTFGLIASRGALGNLERITVLDLGKNRQLLYDEYSNWGNETRVLIQHDFFKTVTSSLAMGFRVYSGFTTRKQGDANADSSSNFKFLSPDNLEVSDYRFPNKNFAVFAENIFFLSENFSITPGIRYEYINTSAKGYYKQRVIDFAGNVVSDTRIEENTDNPRNLFLFGLGASWHPYSDIECYMNISQNYRSITFSDIRINNPNIIVDTNLQDERGFNADIGFRGFPIRGLYCDMSLFYLAYNNRIGMIQKNDVPPLYLPIRYRTNIANSHTYGIETFTLINYAQLCNYELPFEVTSFINLAYQYGRYGASQDRAVEGKEVELVPPLTARLGTSVTYSGLTFTVLYSYTHKHYSDATNAERSSTAVIGTIPSYGILDFSATWKYGVFVAEGGVNNVLNKSYFTRRADGYPGPGIIPSEPISLFLTVGLNLSL